MHVLLLVLAFYSLFSSAGALHQATSEEVAFRERWPDLYGRDGTTAPCVCNDNTVPVDGECYCPDGVNMYECGCPMNACPTTRKRNFNKDTKGAAPTLFANVADFPGEVLSPAVMAQLIQGLGTFTHHNGTLLTDYAYKTHSEELQEHAWGRSLRNVRVFKMIKRNLLYLTAKAFSRTIAMTFDNPYKVFVVSDDFGLESRDIIRLAKSLLADPTQKEFIFWHNVIPRATVEALVATLCPRMGPEFCDD